MLEETNNLFNKCNYETYLCIENDIINEEKERTILQLFDTINYFQSENVCHDTYIFTKLTMNKFTKWLLNSST